MPLKIKGEIIVLQGDSTTKELVFSQSDIKMFASFASQASIIIENARLHEQAQKKIEQLMFLHAVSEKTSATLDLNKLVDIITSTAFRLTQGRCCALFLMDRDRKYMRLVSWKGENRGHGPDPRESRREHLRLGRGQVPLLINDVSQEPRYSEIHPAIASMLSVP